jgi:dCTP deaminase
VVLSDRDIRAALESGRLRIKPYDPTCLQPSSVDLHLDRSFRVFRNNRYPYIDVRQPQPDLTELLTIGDNEPFVLHPGEFVLGQTQEWVELPDDLVSRLEGKSSLGRLGLLIHSTAGYVDPGWKGNLTLELSNVANLPISLYYGMKIGQISFLRMTSPVERPYGSPELGSKYQGQSQPTASAFHRDFGSEKAVAADKPTSPVDDVKGSG